jgi:ABC-2 type transport system permease protein
MKAIAIAWKTLKELWREPLLILLVLFFPLALIGFYKLAFGGAENGLASMLTVLTINQDAGVEQPDGSTWNAGDDLIVATRQLNYQGQPVFTVRQAASEAQALAVLHERKATLLLTIPPGFSAALSGGVPGEVLITGDVSSDNYVFAHSFLMGVAQQMGAALSDQPLTYTIGYEFIPGTGTMSDYDFGVGGILIFGICFLIISSAMVLVRERAQGSLIRLKLSRMSAFDLIAGITLSQLALGVIQMAITLGAAVLLGFDSNGSLLLAGLVGVVTSLAATGLGLMVACFCRNESDAVNIASGVMVPFVFLSGALFPMPSAPLFVVGGKMIQFYDLMPTTHAVEAMRRVLVLGDGIPQLLYPLGMMTALSLLTLLFGVILYHRLQLRKG